MNNNLLDCFSTLCLKLYIYRKHICLYFYNLYNEGCFQCPSICRNFKLHINFLESHFKVKFIMYVNSLCQNRFISFVKIEINSLFENKLIVYVKIYFKSLCQNKIIAYVKLYVSSLCKHNIKAYVKLHINSPWQDKLVNYLKLYVNSSCLDK